MQNKQTLFDHVYRDLREQILTGRLQYGDKLPSISRMCELYNVGIRTVRDVLRALKEEGYISTQERRPTTVQYQLPVTEGIDAAMQSVLVRRTSIIDVYRTMSIIMPPVFALSAQVFGDASFVQWSRDLARLKGKDPAVCWQAYSSLLYTLLDRSHNLLFRDMFASLEIYARTPYFQKHPRHAQWVAAHSTFHSAMQTMESLPTKDGALITTRFQSMFQALTIAVEKWIDEALATCKTPPQEDPNSGYTWTSERGRDHYYTQITRDLIDKIGMGIYREGEFLPSEAALAKQYGVCISTVRKAMAMLGELGFGQTFNAKGTQVLLQKDDEVLQCMKNKTYRRDTLLYLSGLQFMAIAIKPAAMLALPHLDRQVVLDLQKQCRSQNAIPLEKIFFCITDHLPLAPFRTILLEVNKLLHWGYYFSFYSEGPASSNLLFQISFAALDALRQGDANGFITHLSSCYGHILTFVRDFVATRGLPEAADIISPQELH
ncbi:GntR family transcriptional regulator [Neobittarella massiliensis]|uniref:GntR family transcriptional regulator n=1 Tax=Neobittarella massiliensis (ex Bilen et al. 2018) TaxID=2041842 RepID=A0A8J6IKP4_9FIRM|nr:GntR family transcriptional regulator [Neobittarella massiliensis]MBC3515214.1 GntR family transcriptional regulator [Neobittarella massiliensis]